MEMKTWGVVMLLAPLLILLREVKLFCKHYLQFKRDRVKRELQSEGMENI